MTGRLRFRPAASLLAALSLVLAGSSTRAHDIPNDVTIQAFLKPEGQTLRLVVRVPLIAMRDVTWPTTVPGTLDLTRADTSLRNAAILWIANEATFYEGSRALTEPVVTAFRASLRTDRSFESYEGALALVTGPPEPATTDISIDRDFLDALVEYPIQSAASRFSFDSRWARLGQRTVTRVGLVLPDGGMRAFELEGNPGLVRLDPTWYQAGWGFATLGFAHFLGGTDYLLFLCCAVIPLRRLQSLVLAAVAFAVAHSITLHASVFGFSPNALWFAPLIVMLLAVAVIYMAVENMVGADMERRWKTTFVFGLVYGFALAFVLHPTLQFGGAHQAISLLAFNIGLEGALLFALVLSASALALLFRHVVTERTGTILLSALMAHTAWHQMVERGNQLWQYRFEWPELTPAFLADVLRWMMFAVAMACLLWLASVLIRSRRAGERSDSKSGAQSLEPRG